MSKYKIKKEDIIKKISLQTGFSLNLSKKIINNLVDSLLLNIKSDGLNLKNLGSFKIINKKERLGRNPKTKENFIISARKSVSFHVSKKILDKLNNLK